MTLFPEVSNKLVPHESLDGVNHINIYSKGRTPLGRFLSNFARISLSLEGEIFQSIEAYWYWLSLRDRATSTELEILKDASGSYAKKYGQELIKIYGRSKVDNFEERVMNAITLKLRKAPKEIKKEFVSSTLPFEHYYVMHGKVRDVKNNYPWMMELFEDLRREYQQGEK